jgi:hypothetical protein
VDGLYQPQVITNVAPIVAITPPVAQTAVNTAITLVATATDIDGTVASVAFFSTTAGVATPIGTGTLVPDTNNYSLIWTPTTAGTYTISATVINDAAVAVTSAPVTFTVNPLVTLPNVLPIVSVMAPTASTLVNTPISFVANATDSDGTIVSVEFFSTANGIEAPLGAGVMVTGTNTYSLILTPSLDGIYNITAKATDDAGGITTSAAVLFTIDPVVTVPAMQLGVWDFNEGTGVIATDSSGNTQPLQLANVIWTTGKVGHYAGQFNGSNASGAPSAPALIDTTESFTVAAWVKLDTLNGWRTIINQDGENVSGFWLQYSQQLGGIFTFTMRDDDLLSGPVNRTRSVTKPTIGEWYHLVGVRDKAAGIIKLYVNGVLESSVANTVAWSASGDFNVGRGKWDAPNDWFAGAIDEVKVYNYPVTAAEIDALYQAGSIE